jgi:hypothetical protein
MTTLKSQFTAERAFVTNELFIVFALVLVGILGGVILTRALHLGWVSSVGVIAAVVIFVFIGLSFLSTPRKRH